MEPQTVYSCNNCEQVIFNVNMMNPHENFYCRDTGHERDDSLYTSYEENIMQTVPPINNISSQAVLYPLDPPSTSTGLYNNFYSEDVTFQDDLDSEYSEVKQRYKTGLQANIQPPNSVRAHELMTSRYIYQPQDIDRFSTSNNAYKSNGIHGPMNKDTRIMFSDAATAEPFLSNEEMQKVPDKTSPMSSEDTLESDLDHLLLRELDDSFLHKLITYLDPEDGEKLSGNDCVVSRSEDLNNTISSVPATAVPEVMDVDKKFTILNSKTSSDCSLNLVNFLTKGETSVKPPLMSVPSVVPAPYAPETVRKVGRPRKIATIKPVVTNNPIATLKQLPPRKSKVDGRKKIHRSISESSSGGSTDRENSPMCRRDSKKRARKPFRPCDDDSDYNPLESSDMHMYYSLNEGRTEDEQKKRDMNNIASKRSRERKKEKERKLEDECMVLEKRNIWLSSKAKMLQDAYNTLLKQTLNGTKIA